MRVLLEEQEPILEQELVAHHLTLLLVVQVHLVLDMLM